MATFKIGDIVTSKIPIGNKGIQDEILQGVIIKLNTSYAGVEFDRDITGHNCEGKGKNNHCWNIHIGNLKLVDLTNIEPIYDIY